MIYSENALADIKIRLESLEQDLAREDEEISNKARALDRAQKDRKRTARLVESYRETVSALSIHQVS